MKEFKKGLMFGLGAIIIIVPAFLGIGLVDAMNTPTETGNSQTSFAPQNYKFYQFSPKEIDTEIISTGLNKNSNSIVRVYKNYWTGSELVDIIEFADDGLTTQQQTTLNDLYPHKKIKGSNELPVNANAK